MKQVSRVAIETLYVSAGLSIADCAAMLKSSRSAVHRAMIRYGIRRRPPGSRAFRKVTGQGEVDFIRSLVADGTPQIEVARMLRLHPSTISRIACGKLWPSPPARC